MYKEPKKIKGVNQQIMLDVSAGENLAEDLVYQHGATPHKELSQFKPNIQPVIMYKTFKLRLDKDGNNLAPGFVFPLYVNTENGLSGKQSQWLKIGKWYKSGEGECWLDTNNNRLYTKGKGYGTDGNTISKLAYRPGWHLTTTPWGNQRGDGKIIGGKPGTGNNYANTRNNEVWAKVEICVDIDATEKARAQSTTPADQCLDKLGDREYYKYKTNSNATDDQAWYIVDTIRIVEILDDDSVDSINQEYYNNIIKQNPNKRLNNNPYDYTSDMENDVPYWKMSRSNGKRYSKNDLEKMGYTPSELTKLNERKNEDGEDVPKKCTECGGDIALEIHGEPVFLCKKCGKYYGVLPFKKHLRESIVDGVSKTKYQLASAPFDGYWHVIDEEIENVKPKDREIKSFSKSKLKDLFENNINLSVFNPQKELNPQIWYNNRLNSKVRMKLLDVADNFIDDLKVDWVKPKDIILTGSLANYNWSKYSDIDLHILIDFKEVDDRIDFVKDYFNDKKLLWNEKHNIKMYGFPVEIYVQDVNELHTATGIYSLEKDKWLVEPQVENFKSLKLNKYFIKQKSEDIINLIKSLEKQVETKDDSYDLEKISNKVKTLFDKLKGMRKESLQSVGEMGTGNIIYKVIKRLGYLERLIDLKTKTYDKMKSLK